MKKVIVAAVLIAILSTGTIAVAETEALPSDIQKLFKNRCARCHAGSKPPKGLSLTADRAAAVVGTPSAEAPDFLLINPDDPGASYLLKKVRGDEGIKGRRMPLGGHLTPEEIKLLEAWVAGLKK